MCSLQPTWPRPSRSSPRCPATSTSPKSPSCPPNKPSNEGNTTVSKNPKTVLITGASSGIGEAAALRLADDGHRLFLGARRTERLEALVGRIEAAGGTASFRRLDVTDAADVQRFVADAIDTYGGVDVMINNAGVMPLSTLAEDKVDEWNRMIDVNIRGVLHGISAALPVMRAQG